MSYLQSVIAGLATSHSRKSRLGRGLASRHMQLNLILDRLKGGY
jgi:hypothetical protein